MKHLILAAGLLLMPSLLAQTGRTVTLTWTDAVNPTGTTYTVKRAVGLCSGTPTYSTVATGITAKTFQDANVAVGNYCYVVTATFSGLESSPSNSAGAAVLPAPPTLGNITVAEVRVEAPPTGEDD